MNTLCIYKFADMVRIYTYIRFVHYSLISGEIANFVLSFSKYKLLHEEKKLCIFVKIYHMKICYNMVKNHPSLTVKT